MAAALIASLVAIAAYFRLFGGASDLFLLYGRAPRHLQGSERARRVPVLPALLVLQRMLAGRLVDAAARSCCS